MNPPTASAPGTVSLIGAGPGDPGLMTVKGLARLKAAQVVIYDRLANPELLDSLAPGVLRIDVGKRHGNDRDHKGSHSQQAINQLLVEHALGGARVARLKGGDPFIFGRGGEEAQALAAAGIPFEVVPGVTAATAVAAYAGIPLTQRGINTTVTFVTGQEDPNKAETSIHWQELGRADGTLVFFMGVRSLPTIVEKLIAGGRAADTPSAIIQWGTHPHQRTVTAPLSELPQQAAGITPPALIVVGRVVTLRQQIDWFEQRPLFGKRILTTRSVAQQGQLAERLRDMGGHVICAPTLQLVPPEDFSALDAAIDALGSIDWLVLTSGNGVDAFFARLRAQNRDSRALAGLQVAVVGRQSAKALSAHGITADLIPADAHGEGLAAALMAIGVDGKTVLLAQAENARPVLANSLTQAGATVKTVISYRSIVPDRSLLPAELLADDTRVDYATFTSGATVNHLQQLLGQDRFMALLSHARIASIGPVTSRAIEQAGLSVHIQPHHPSVAALAEAVAADAGGTDISTQENPL